MGEKKKLDTTGMNQQRESNRKLKCSIQQRVIRLVINIFSSSRKFPNWDGKEEMVPKCAIHDDTNRSKVE